jgi:hypothetical protein
MSEENNGSAVISGFSTGTYDYLDQKPEAKTPSKPNAEQKEQSQGQQNAPWEVPEEKQKGQTPLWARQRFHELTTRAKGAEERAISLEKRLEAFEKGLNPDNGEIKLEKFRKEDGSPDIEAFTKALTQSATEKARKEWEENFKKNQEAERTASQIREIEEKNYATTKAQIPGLDDALNAIDPSLELEQSALDHLRKSPVGYKTLYRIGVDEELQKQIIGMGVKERTAVIAQIHDSILEYEIAQQQQQGQAPNKPIEAQPVAQPPRKPIPAPPPKQRGSGEHGNPSLSMSGDEWIKAKNAQKKR